MVGFLRRKTVRDARGQLHDTTTGRFVSETRGGRIRRLMATARSESDKVDRRDTGPTTGCAGGASRP